MSQHFVKVIFATSYLKPKVNIVNGYIRMSLPYSVNKAINQLSPTLVLNSNVYMDKILRLD